MDYSGPRSSDGMVDWIKKNVGPSLVVVDKEALEKKIQDRAFGGALIAFDGADAEKSAQVLT